LFRLVVLAVTLVHVGRFRAQQNIGVEAKNGLDKVLKEFSNWKLDCS